MTGDDDDERGGDDRHRAKEQTDDSVVPMRSLAMRAEESHNDSYMVLTWPGSTDSPDRPEKMELVSDGTSSTPTVNVIRIITA